MLTLVFEERSVLPGAEPARVVNEWRDDAGQVFATGSAGPQHRWIHWRGLGAFRFSLHSRTVHVTAAPDISRDRLADLFARIVQPLILQAQGLPVLHGSAVSGPGGVLVFCGLTFSGKSTLAFAVGAEPGFVQFADDAVVIRPDAGDADAFIVEPIPFRARLRPSAAGFFGPDASNGVWTTRVARADGQRLRAVIGLTQSTAAAGNAPAILEPVSPAAAFRLLLTHAHCFDDSDRSSVGPMVETYLAMAAAVPVYQLTYQPDFQALPRLVSLVSGLMRDATCPSNGS
jgi:hypothetical protein